MLKFCQRTLKILKAMLLLTRPIAIFLVLVISLKSSFCWIQIKIIVFVKLKHLQNFQAKKRRHHQKTYGQMTSIKSWRKRSCKLPLRSNKFVCSWWRYSAFCFVLRLDWPMNRPNLWLFKQRTWGSNQKFLHFKFLIVHQLKMFYLTES